MLRHTVCVNRLYVIKRISTLLLLVIGVAFLSLFGLGAKRNPDTGGLSLGIPNAFADAPYSQASYGGYSQASYGGIGESGECGACECAESAESGEAGESC